MDTVVPIGRTGVRRERARLAAIGDTDVTQSRDVLLFRPG